MKQLHTLPSGEIVLIDWVKLPKKVTMEAHINRVMEIHAYIPTLGSDKSTWLELSKKCGGKLEEGVHYSVNNIEVGSTPAYDNRTSCEVDQPIYEGTAIPISQDADEIWDKAMLEANAVAKKYIGNKEPETFGELLWFRAIHHNHLRRNYKLITRKS